MVSPKRKSEYVCKTCGCPVRKDGNYFRHCTGWGAHRTCKQTVVPIKREDYERKQHANQDH